MCIYLSCTLDDFYSHSPLPLIQDGQLSATGESMCKCTGELLRRPKPAQEQCEYVKDQLDITVIVLTGP